MAVKDYMLGARPVVEEGQTPEYMKGAEPATDVPAAAMVDGAANLSPAQAAKALDISRQTGLSPSYIAGDLDGALKARERGQMAGIDSRPVLKSWASQSDVHAAAVKHDYGPLGKVEGWLSGMGDALVQGAADLGAAEAMREYMGGERSGPLYGSALDLEEATRQYDQVKHSFPEQVARAIPQVAGYGVASFLAGGAGLAGLLYSQNKGVLARRIQLAQPQPPEDTRHFKFIPGRQPQMVGEVPEPGLSREEIDNYAAVGSAVSAVTLAGVLGPLVKSLPGVREGLQDTAASVLSRAAATTPGQAAIKALSAYGQHTLMGAVGMALQATVNSGTVQKATRGDVDFKQLGREGLDTFLEVLPLVAVLSAYGPGRDYLADRGRIAAASTDAVAMRQMVENARQASVVKHSPDLIGELFGAMGRGARAYVDGEAAAGSEALRKMGGLGFQAQLDEARVAQGPVSVDLGRYLAHAADEHKTLADHVSLSQDGMTPAQARETDTRMRGMMSPEDARALYGRLPPDELQGLDMPIAADMPESMRRQFNEVDKKTANQRTPETGATDTVAAKPLHEVMAAEYGGTPEEWAQRLTPELMSALNEEGSVGAVSPEEHAARFVEAMPIDHIDPGAYRRLAKKADKYIREAAEKARSGEAAGAKKGSVKDVVALSTYELARDLNEAKAKRAEAVLAELKKSTDRMAKQVMDNKLRAQLNLAGPPLLHLFDALTEGSGVSPMRRGWLDAHAEAVDTGLKPLSPEATRYADARMVGALDEVQAWFKDHAWPTAYDEDAVRQFLSKQKPWGELTPSEARQVADAVGSLVDAAKRETTVRDGDGRATVREGADEIRAELSQNPDKGLPYQTGVEVPWMEQRMMDLNAANAVELRPKNNLRQKSAAAVRLIFDRIGVEALYLRDQLARDILKPWGEAFDKLPKEMQKRRYETYDLSDKLPVQGTQPMKNVPRQWVWKLARHWGSSGNVDRITSTSGWDREALSNILFDDPQTKLTIPEWDYLQKLGDISEQKVWPLVKDHFEKNYGLAPKKVAAVPFRVRMEDGTWKDYAGGYEPLKRDARPGVATQAAPTKGIAQYWGNDFQIPWMPGSVKERVDNSHYLVNMDWDTTRSSLAQTLHWLAYDQPVRDVAKLLNDPLLAADMNQYMGQGRAGQTRAWLKSSATQQSSPVPEGQEIVAKVFGWQRRLSLMGIVGDSVRFALAQISHPFGLMLGGQINPVHGIPALVSTFKPFSLANGEVRLMPNWSDALTHGREVQHRADRAFSQLTRDLVNIGQAGRQYQGPLGALAQVSMATAGFFLHAVDRLTTTWAWTAAHNEAVARFKMEPFSPEAKAYANGKVQDVMPVHDLETAAPILTNRQLGGFLIMHGFKNTLYQFRADAVNASRLDFYRAQGATGYAGAIAKTTGRVALQAAMFGGFAIMGKLLLGVGQKDDETKGQYLFREFLGGQTVDIPLIGGLGEPLAKLVMQKAWGQDAHLDRHDVSAYGSPGLSAVNHAADLLGSLVNEGREDYKKVFDVLEGLLFYRGFPSRPVRNGAEHVYQTLMGEEYGPDGFQAGRLFYSEKQWDSIKRTLSPDED